MVAVYQRLAEARANLKNSLVHEGETHLFTPLMESWEIMLVEETQQEPRCFGPIVPGCEVCCNLLDLL